MKGWVRVENSYGSWLLLVGLDMGCRKPDAEIRKRIVGGMDSISFFYRPRWNVKKRFHRAGRIYRIDGPG
jgi:hypothetical protein